MEGHDSSDGEAATNNSKHEQKTPAEGGQTGSLSRNLTPSSAASNSTGQPASPPLPSHQPRLVKKNIYLKTTLFD